MATLGVRLTCVSVKGELVALIYVPDKDYARSPAVPRRPSEGERMILFQFGRRPTGTGGRRDAGLRAGGAGRPDGRRRRGKRLFTVQRSSMRRCSWASSRPSCRTTRAVCCL